MRRNEIYRSKDINFKLRKIVYYIMGIIEVILAFRLVFKFLGANPGNTFVSLIYTISKKIIAPFSGIFRSAVNKGIETKSVWEPTTIIAMIVYALIAYGVVRLIEIFSNNRHRELR
ncbi:YggT family protein [Clostridium sp.]